MTMSSATHVVVPKVPDSLRARWARGGCRHLTPSGELEKEASAGNGCSPLKHMESLYFSHKERDEPALRAGLCIQRVLS